MGRKKGSWSKSRNNRSRRKTHAKKSGSVKRSPTSDLIEIQRDSSKRKKPSKPHHYLYDILLGVLFTITWDVCFLLSCKDLEQARATLIGSFWLGFDWNSILFQPAKRLGFNVRLLYEIFCMNAQTYYRELIDWLLSHVNDSDMFVMQSMVTTCALFWLLYRAWKTLWTPVPQLISVLGIEVPDPPTVSLAGIKADAVTLHWTRPEPHKAVFKYLIQVNGVNVGESSKTETAITVTGLKPSHFYNVRVIAVGSSNFQTGSKVIRLQTYDRYGRPNLPNGRLPSSFVLEDTQNGPVVEDNDASAGVRSHGTAVESAVVPEAAPVMAREHSGGHSGQRRNTVSRKHSASTASAEQPAVVAQSEPPESMQQLTEKFESIREEIEEVNAQTSKEAEEFNCQIAELEKEKTRLRQILKEKEEASEKLKKEVNYAERANRQAQNRRTQKEKELKEKQAERAKKRDEISKWKRDLEAMKKEREQWARETRELKAAHDKKMKELREVLEQEQKVISRLEEEIRIKGLQIKELEVERQNLPGARDDEEAKAEDELDRQKDLEWEKKEKDYITQINDQTLAIQQIANNTHRVQLVYGEMLARQSGSAGGLMMHGGNPSSGDIELPNKQKGRQRRSRHRKSRNGTMSSPSAYYSSHDHSYMGGGLHYDDLAPVPADSPSFAPGPYFDMNSHGSGMVPLSEQIGMSEFEVRSMTAGAPLSPTAASLLPSNIFSDEDQPSPDESFTPSFGHSYPYGPSFENDPQSPLSDGSHSASLVSSPRNSSQNLKRFSGNMEAYFENDRRSNSMNSPGREYGVTSDSSSGNHVPTRRFDFLNSFRPRGKASVEEGLPLGSLKHGQSHSFPRQTDENVPPGFRNRRTSFSSGWTNLGFRSRNSPAGEVTEGNGPAPARNASTARRRKGIFSSAIDRDESHSAFDRDPNSPRPASIASSDLPRPSTGSARMIWGQSADETALKEWGSSADVTNLNRNSPRAPNWSLNVAQPWSRNPSRRPSIQYSSTTAVNLTTGIVSDEDGFLPYTRHQSSPPPAGVIGGPRPKSAHKPTPPPITPKLNPAAPTFKTIFTRSSKHEKDKGKAKTKDKDVEVSDIRDDISPTTSRKSRDTRSIRTQDSHAESHDSFAGGLERETSNTTSEMNPPSIASTKDKGENSFQKLLRKGSSSKFSFSGKGTLWGAVNKKAGSGAGSDRIDDYDENEMMSKSYDSNGGGKDSITSSPVIGGGGFGSSGGQRRSINLGSWGSRMLSKGKKETSENESGFSNEETEDGDAPQAV